MQRTTHTLRSKDGISIKKKFSRLLAQCNLNGRIILEPLPLNSNCIIKLDRESKKIKILS